MALDRDLNSIQQARDLVAAARSAQSLLATFTQEQIDSITYAMTQAALANAERLAEQAVQETGFGVVADKVIKNRFSSEKVYEFFKSLKTVGIIKETEKIIEIAEPRGVVAAIIPSTNPTSTTIFKALICIKSRNTVVFSPHPAAVGCITETVRILREAAESAGLPSGAINCLTISTLAGTDALMKHEQVAVILATGGIGLVRAAYSSGKPAFGVGPGNVPAFIERSANVEKAVADILAGKTFDNGTVCASEQAVVVEQVIEEQVRFQFESQGAYFLNQDEANKLAQLVVLPSRGLNPAIVGKSVEHIANASGIKVPTGTRVLIAKLEGVGRDFPLSIEKLSPILAYYVVPDFNAASDLCTKILKFGGMGHSVGIHSNNHDLIREFGICQPSSRILVNTPTTHGAIGFSTDLSPSMTLGCGSWGGNVTSDNISPLHLLDIKRIAFETVPVTTNKVNNFKLSSTISSDTKMFNTFEKTAFVPDRAYISEIVGQLLAERKSSVSKFLSSDTKSISSETNNVVEKSLPADQEPSIEKAVAFVCEEDVRAAILANKKILTDKKTIITPSARDLGNNQSVFIGFAAE